ncbi:MAG: RidA family protein [Pseudomonadota bacterium]
MTRTAITTGSRYEELGGYSRAVIDGEWVFVSGTAGYDPATNVFPDDPVDQARRCLQTIEETLAKADATMADIVRVRVYVSDRAYVEGVARELGTRFSDPRPTNTTVVCDLATEEMKVEIEVTALRRR